jgi:hypothetical protein
MTGTITSVWVAQHESAYPIDEDNEVRFIDLFVDRLSMQEYGFEMEYVENGRPAYHLY